METLKAPRRVVGLASFVVAVLAISTALSVFNPASAKISPDLAPRTLRTEHFRIHYPVETREFAELLAVRLEEAFRFLSKDLDWQPTGAIDTVVRTDVDGANGSAEVFPTNRLVIHALPPTSWGFDAESDDWLRTLAIHELTHIIANDQTSGVFDVLRGIIGTAAKPNPYQPLWLVEGLAVYEETRFTGVGRGRSAWTDMILRTAANSGILDAEENPAKVGSDPTLRVSIDRLNDGVDRWPDGHVPYLFGYALNEVIADQAKLGAPEKISKQNSRYLPFAIESVAKDVVGEGYGKIWAETVGRLKRLAKTDADRVRAAGAVTAVKPVTFIGRKTRGLARAKTSVYFISDSYRHGTGISRVSFPNGGGEPAVEDVTTFRPFDPHASTEIVGTRLRADVSGRSLLYSRTELYQGWSQIADAFLYDLESKTETQISFGARARDPDFSPDFSWDAKEKKVVHGSIVYVKDQDGARESIVTTIGAFAPRETDRSPVKVSESVLREGEKLERLSLPTWGRGDFSDWIFYVAKSESQGASLEAIHTRSKKRIALTKAVSVGETIASLEWESDGSLVFASNRGGIFNLRRIVKADLRTSLETGRIPNVSTLTNTETGFFDSVEIPGAEGSPRRVAIAYSERGLDLVSIDLPVKGAGVKTPSLEPLHDKLRNRIEPHRGIAGESTAKLESDSYSVLPALWPHYWAPDLRKVPDGLLWGARTSGRDAWEMHYYELFLRADTRANFPVWNALYRYDGMYPTFEFSAHQENYYFATTRESNRIQSNQANVYVPTGRDANVGLGAVVETSRLSGEKETTGGFELSWDFKRMRVNPDSIDREGESGVAGRLGLTGYFGGEERFSEFKSRFETRVPSLFDRHFFRLNADYGSSNNDKISAHYFLGGGEDTISADGTYLLRGYEPGSVWGRKILTANFEYVFPVVDLFRGFGTFPLFFNSSRLVLFFDTGSAEVVGNETVNLDRFVTGAGVHLLSDFNLLYRVPVTFAIGYDHGFRADAGGESQIVLGLYSRLP